jgi:hypothetical protein
LRTRVRALYEAAEFDHAAQEELRKLLNASAACRERFLEALALERLSDHFSTKVLRHRLGPEFDNLRAHASDALWNRDSSGSISNMLQGLIHIDEQNFLRAAPRLLEFSLPAERELEDLCIALLDLLYWPPMPASFYELLQNQEPSTVELVKSTERAITVRRTTRSIGDLITNLNFVKTTLGRSSHLYDRLDRLSKISVDELTNAQLFCADVHDAWSLEVLPKIAFITKHAQWGPLVRRHEQLATSLQQLNASVAHIRVLHNSAVADRETVAGQLKSVASQAISASQMFVDVLTELSINPLNSTLANIPDRFRTKDGSIVHVERQIDFTIPRVFCSMSALNDVIQELTVNWFKFKDRADAQLRVRASVKGGTVILAFEDNYLGAVNQSSAGGWHMAKKFCRDYGGDIRVVESDGWKSIQLRLRTPESTVEPEEE